MLSDAVTRWTPYVKKHSPSWPLEMILRWIDHETGGGRYNTEGSWHTGTAHGIFQISQSTIDDTGLWTKEEADFLLEFPGYPFKAGYDAERHYQLSARALEYYRKRAQALADEAGLRWTGKDFLALVKLRHGLPAIIVQGLKAFRDALGRAPRSWVEWSTWLRSTGFSLGAWDAKRVSEILANAEGVVWAGKPTERRVWPLVLGAAVLGGIGWWFWKGRKKG